MTVVSDSHHQSTLDVVYVYGVPWSEFSIVPSYPHYHPESDREVEAGEHEQRPGRQQRAVLPSYLTECIN